MTKPLRIYSAAWGSYLNWFERGTIQSFKWPKNNQALLNADATWCVLTKEQDAERAYSIVKSTGLDKIEILLIPDEAKPDHTYNQSMVWGFISEMTRCLDLNHAMLIAPPDLIFSEGSIPYLIARGQEPNTCIHIPHVRVFDSFFNHVSDNPMSGKKMVDYSFMDMHLHDSWRFAKWGSDQSTSFHGGISWQTMPDNSMAVTHLLPSPFYMNFIPSDLTYWLRQEWFGAFDHQWPSQLCKQNRSRLITHSNQAYIVEITKASERTPEMFPGNLHDPTGFHRDLFHNQVMRTAICTFEGT